MFKEDDFASWPKSMVALERYRMYILREHSRMEESSPRLMKQWLLHSATLMLKDGPEPNSVGNGAGKNKKKKPAAYPEINHMVFLETDAVNLVGKGDPKAVTSFIINYTPNDVRVPGQPNFWGFIKDLFVDVPGHPNGPYAKYLLRGVLPPPVDQSRGLVLSKCDWLLLSSKYNVATCVHTAFEGDMTYQRRGTYHLVMNIGYSTAIAGDVLYRWGSHPLLPIVPPLEPVDEVVSPPARYEMCGLAPRTSRMVAPVVIPNRVRGSPTVDLVYLAHSRRILLFQAPVVLMSALTRLVAVTPGCCLSSAGPDKDPVQLRVNLPNPPLLRKVAYQEVLDSLQHVCLSVLQGMRATHSGWEAVKAVVVRGCAPGLDSDHLSPKLVRYGASALGWENVFHRDQPRIASVVVNSFSSRSSRRSVDLSLSGVITLRSGDEFLEIEDPGKVGTIISVHTSPAQVLVFPPHFQHRIPRTEGDRLTFAFSMHGVYN
jgi:hypothetical protein